MKRRSVRGTVTESELYACFGDGRGSPPSLALVATVCLQTSGPGP